MNLKHFISFSDAITYCGNQLRDCSYPVHPRKWQGMPVSDKPEMAMYEVLNTSFSVFEPGATIERLQHAIRPNLPWAEDHFMERVGGQPLNPGVEWANWPYARSADRFRDQEAGAFTHTYMERFWPIWANRTPGGILDSQTEDFFNEKPNRGYRYELGDLGDLIVQLAFEPDTRQAYLPVWFPEDTGVKHKGRVPCTIGYHFILRHEMLDIVYQLRSCDFVRHFRDDIYLAMRLMLHVLWECQRLNPKAWEGVMPGIYAMHMTSLHMFKNDYRATFGKPHPGGRV